jgi:DMSO reductase iron-sulfur subunit
MALPLHERAQDGSSDTLVRLTLDDFLKPMASAPAALPSLAPMLIPDRPLEPGEQYRFHFNMTKCIGCRSCEIACNEQNGNPTEIRWRRIGEIEGGVYPNTSRHYLSMGCNHCLDADCLKGCPVDAYTKDPVTGIVLHSADACIGCQYCVWNCPYSVPQFNEERGVVGKCDMCHGRLTDGLEPACVNACPEGAIEIEIVDMLAWRSDYALAESPGMPAAGHTISTTRITLPPDTATKLERVDAGRIAPEHAHFSLVFMTTLIQAVTGSLVAALLFHAAQPFLLIALLGMTAVALNISVFHLGRPLYALRAQDVATLLAKPRSPALWLILYSTRWLHPRKLPQRFARNLAGPSTLHSHWVAPKPAGYDSGSFYAWDPCCSLRYCRRHRQFFHLPGPGETVLEHGAHARRLPAERSAFWRYFACCGERNPRSLSVLGGRFILVAVDRQSGYTPHPAQSISHL